MAECLRRTDIESLYKLQMPHDNDLLVSKDRHPKYSSAQIQMSNGYLLNTHSSTDTKKKQLEYIIKKLELDWKVEIVK